MANCCAVGVITNAQAFRWVDEKWDRIEDSQPVLLKKCLGRKTGQDYLINV